MEDMEDGDVLAGVKCCGKGCKTVFSATDASAGAHTTDCGHSLCGTCAALFLPQADIGILNCPLCDSPNPSVRPNPGLSMLGDVLLAKARACGSTAERDTEAHCEHAEQARPAQDRSLRAFNCVVCETIGQSRFATHRCSNCDKIFCHEDSSRHSEATGHVINSLQPDVHPATVHLTVSNCHTHPGSLVDMFCVDCLSPLCAKCALAGHQGHLVAGIHDTSALAPKVRSFLDAAQKRAQSAHENTVYVAAARTSLLATRQRVIAEVSALKNTMLKAMSDHFDHLLSIIATEVAEREKALDTQGRECAVVAAQLNASTRLCESAISAANNVALSSALHTTDLMAPMLKPFAGLAATTDLDVVLDPQPLFTALKSFGYVVQFPVDAATSEIASGSMPAVVDMVAAAAGGIDVTIDSGVYLEDANTVTLIPRGAAGNIVRLREDEVRLSVCDTEGHEVGVSSVVIHEDASVHMKFELADVSVRQPVLTVFVRGALLKRWTSLPFDLRFAKHVSTITMFKGYRRYGGMAVAPNGRYMVVSYYSEDQLRVYRIEADGSSSLLHTVGARSAQTGPKQLSFNGPYKMCLARNGNMLVCDYKNDRVQELTGPGETQPAHVRDIKAPKAWSIAVHGDLVAVGTCDATIMLLSYESGKSIRTVGSKGTGRGNIGVYSEGLRFTPDGHSILVAEYGNKRLSMFRASDGAFLDFYCKDQVSDGYKDVEILPSGEVVVADYEAHRICVFSADGRTLLRTWGSRGTADGQFKYPTALARFERKLFVLDRKGSRMQVFM